jgi:hypothetical protein
MKKSGFSTPWRFDCLLALTKAQIRFAMESIGKGNASDHRLRLEGLRPR